MHARRLANWAVCLLCTLLGASWHARGTDAVVNARVGNPGNALATSALYGPTGLSASVAGHLVVLGWNPGQNGSGYAVEGVANGSSSSCAGASFADVGSTAETTFTDAERFEPQGTFYCYRVKTTYGTAWTSVGGNPRVAAQIGFVATSTTLTNGGVAGTLDTGDRIVVRFNQPVDPSTGPQPSETVCATSSGVVALGSSTTTGPCSATETTSVGTLSGGTVTSGARWNATYTWLNANTTLRVVLRSRIGGSLPVVATGSWVFNPTTTAANLASATGGFHVCDTNVGGGECLPAGTGAF